MIKTHKICSATMVLCLFSAFTIFANVPVNADPNVGIPMRRSALSTGTSFDVTAPVLPPAKHMATLTANKQVTGTYLDLDSGGRYDTVSVAQASSDATLISPFVNIDKATTGNWLGMYIGHHVPAGYDFNLLGYSTGLLSDSVSGYWYYN